MTSLEPFIQTRLVKFVFASAASNRRSRHCLGMEHAVANRARLNTLKLEHTHMNTQGKARHYGGSCIERYQHALTSFSIFFFQCLMASMMEPSRPLHGHNSGINSLVITKAGNHQTLTQAVPTSAVPSAVLCPPAGPFAWHSSPEPCGVGNLKAV